MERKLIILLLTLASLVGIAQAQDISVGTDDPTKPTGYGSSINFLGAALNSDPLWLARYNISGDQTELRMNIGDDLTDRFVIGSHFYLDNTYHPAFTFFASGYLGIGTEHSTERLTVNGKIRASDIRVDGAIMPDYVFDPGYKRLSLTDLEAYINKHKHLPEIPSAMEAAKNGIELGEMNKLLLKKIEELTLYMIEQKNDIEVIKKENGLLKVERLIVKE